MRLFIKDLCMEKVFCIRKVAQVLAIKKEPDAHPITNVYILLPMLSTLCKNFALRD